MQEIHRQTDTPNFEYAQTQRLTFEGMTPDIRMDRLTYEGLTAEMTYIHMYGRTNTHANFFSWMRTLEAKNHFIWFCQHRNENLLLNNILFNCETGYTLVQKHWYS